MGVKMYGAQTKRVFTVPEVKRKARMIVAMLLEMRLAPGPACDHCRDHLGNIPEELKAVATIARKIAETPDDAFTTTTQPGA